MQASQTIWSEAEKTIAQAAFTNAYQREINALIQEVHDRSKQIKAIEDVWHLHDFLSARRHELDGKYDNRDAALVFVFADLLREGWLQVSEIEGLDADKIKKISALARM
ncbi:MAG: hypothetical protein HC895_23805 [Leptolyngbyaceae cyanobacterium SM1_3_5]|nr:hypothetical protein [Leptolyngbyaceae cyanobacterium SM1_3_5]